MELFCEEVCVDVDGELGVEGQPTDPVDQLDHDGVADLPELALKVLGGLAVRTSGTPATTLVDGGKVNLLKNKTHNIRAIFSCLHTITSNTCLIMWNLWITESKLRLSLVFHMPRPGSRNCAQKLILV